MIPVMFNFVFGDDHSIYDALKFVYTILMGESHQGNWIGPFGQKKKQPGAFGIETGSVSKPTNKDNIIEISHNGFGVFRPKGKHIIYGGDIEWTHRMCNLEHKK
jgi:hypothetical protein